MKHTPGPWNVKLGSDYAVIRSDHHFRGEIAEIATTQGVKFTEEDAANARLIAAAPELLEALTMVRDADEDCRRDGLPTIPAPARAVIDAAIAKAEGNG